MEKNMVTFRLLHNRQIAEEMAEVLRLRDIETEIVQNRRYFDPSFAFNKTDPDINLKLRPGDFEPAMQALDAHYRQQAEQADPHYYLFRFSDEELLEIMMKPDEWGFFDQALAGKILAERGIEIPQQAIAGARERRWNELRKPEGAEAGWIFVGYFAAVCGGFFGMLIGWLFLTLKKTMPDGQRPWMYDEPTRVHGRRMMIIGGIVFSAVMIVGMLRTLI